MGNRDGFVVNNTVEFEVKKRFAPFKGMRKVLMIIGIVALIILLGIYVYGVNKYRTRFFDRTNINGVNASGLTVEEVEEQIADHINSYELRIVERGDKVEMISGEDINYRYVSQGEVQEFLKMQNAFLWPFYLGKDTNRMFDSSASYDAKLLNKKINKMKAFNKDKVKAPQNAKLDYRKGEYVIIPEKKGNQLVKDEAKQYIIQSVDYAKREIVLEEEGLYKKPSVSRDDKALVSACKKLNKYLEADITYMFGKDEITVDADQISEWLSYDNNGDVTLDENAIYQFVSDLADTYDTYGKQKAFHTHDGRTVYLYAEEYGWEMDQDVTAMNLVTAIKKGKQGEGQVEYIHTAKSHDNADCGDSYVEVDMGLQHVWMFIDGEEVVSTDCVTGMYTDDSRRTPEGIYSLYYKESPSILRGENNEYESYVEYWMPFNGGIGLHDAIWRYGVFGGDLYMYDGSHGCVNLPLEAAASIYAYIYEGFPVVCYY